jgi:hypothetical protein
MEITQIALFLSKTVVFFQENTAFLKWLRGIEGNHPF